MSAVSRRVVDSAACGNVLLPMTSADLAEVASIENDVYPHPWTHGNFVDSLSSGYQCHVLRNAEATLLGYFLVMFLVDEVHLLNLSVRLNSHGKGIGRYLLGQIVQLAVDARMVAILLEVRPSNQRALTVYEHYGFVRIGMRRDYYPAADSQREDAIVMRLTL